MNQLMAVAWALLQPNKTQNGKAQNDIGATNPVQGHQTLPQNQHPGHTESRSAHSDLRDRSTNFMEGRLRRTSPLHHNQDFTSNPKSATDRDGNPQSRQNQQPAPANRDMFENTQMQ
jgi:hypothetical protein